MFTLIIPMHLWQFNICPTDYSLLYSISYFCTVSISPPPVFCLQSLHLWLWKEDVPVRGQHHSLDTLHCTALYFVSLCLIELNYNTLHYTALYFTSLCLIVLHYTTLHCTALYFTSLCMIVLHYNTLH